jgi:hypothetical protein
MKSTIIAFVLGCLSAGILGVLVTAPAAEAKSPVRWEYQVGADLRYPLDVAKLNKLGGEGWEAVGATGTLVLMKRER